MTNRLLGLRHDVVVSSNDDDGNIRYLSTTSTHGSKCLVTWRIEESDVLAVLHLHVVCTDVLSDTTSLTCNHIGLANIVEERSLTVVNVSHHGDDWCARNEVFWIILHFLHSVAHFLTHVRSREAKFFCHQVDGFSIQTLVDRHHDANRHTGSDNLRNRNIHHRGKVVGSYELGQLQYFALCIFLLFEFCHTVMDILALLLTILHTLLHLLGCEACECFLHLLCNFFVGQFNLFHWSLTLLALLVLTTTLLLVLATKLTTTLLLVVLFLLIRIFLYLTGSRDDIHLLLVDTVTLLLLASALSILLTALLSLAFTFLFLTLLLALLLALLVRTSLGVDRIEVEKTHLLELHTCIWSLRAINTILTNTFFVPLRLNDFWLRLFFWCLFSLSRWRNRVFWLHLGSSLFDFFFFLLSFRLFFLGNRFLLLLHCFRWSSLWCFFHSYRLCWSFNLWSFS